MPSADVFPKFHEDLIREPGAPVRPEVGPEEQVQVALSFNQAFDNWGGLFSDRVESCHDETGRQLSQLRQVIKTEDELYELVVMEVGPRVAGPEALNISPSEDCRRLINFFPVQNGRYSGMSSYRLCADGIVRRYDIDGEVEDLRRELAHKDLLRVRNDEEYQEKMREAARNHVENIRFEEQMGVNSQPISLAEMKGLADFLSDSLRPNTPPTQGPDEGPSPYL